MPALNNAKEISNPINDHRIAISKTNALTNIPSPVPH